MAMNPIIKNVVDAKIRDKNIMTLLCETDDKQYKVIEFTLDLNNIQLIREQEEISSGLRRIIIEDKCTMSCPIKPKVYGNCSKEALFIIRDWE